MTINQLQDEIIADFEFFGNDWDEKYEYIISTAKTLRTLETAHKTEQNIIKGCQSQVWLHGYLDDQKRLVFEADSDAIITKGLVAMLIRVLSDHTPKEIVEADIYFMDAIGLKNHLSPTRSNGLLSMLKQMRLTALALSNQ